VKNRLHESDEVLVDDAEFTLEKGVDVEAIHVFVCFDSEPKGQGRLRAFNAIMGEEARVIQTRRCL